MNEHNINVSINLNLPAVRLLYRTLCRAYENWPGGDPEEQVGLESMTNDMYRILYDTLLKNDLV